MASRSPAHTEAASRVWSAMHAFVGAHDRRRELQDALGLGRGLGRVKVLVLLTGGPMTLRDIADATGVDAPYATVIVDKLVSRGLAERTAHPDDLRRKHVKLTASGQDAAALAQQILAQPPAAISALAPGDLALLEDVLTRLAAASADAPAPDVTDGPPGVPASALADRTHRPAMHTRAKKVR
jgi:DNA-binding MarR family transcriptional regulator